jgi:predicted dehydrogenase
LKIGLGIIGCGLIGGKRAQAASERVKLISCFDIDSEKAKVFANTYNCKNVSSINQIIKNPEISAVIVSTRHDSLARISEQILTEGKHVFVEKPGALNAFEFSKLVQAKESFNDTKIHIGYNHRHHPSIIKALELCRTGQIGKILFLRSRYGHGGRLGYEKEWRSDKNLSGGGELIDQGSHLLDLTIAFLGEVTLEYAATPTYFWKMPVEDNAFLVVKNELGCIGFLHASCTEWKNTFSLEIYGEKGKLDISGLGGSYGTEKLTFHKMLPEMGVPKSETWEFTGQDDSWSLEFQLFINDIINNTSYSNNIESSIKVLDLISDAYKRSGR